MQIGLKFSVKCCITTLEPKDLNVSIGKVGSNVGK